MQGYCHVSGIHLVGTSGLREAGLILKNESRYSQYFPSIQAVNVPKCKTIPKCRAAIICENCQRDFALPCLTPVITSVIFFVMDTHMAFSLDKKGLKKPSERGRLFRATRPKND